MPVTVDDGPTMHAIEFVGPAMDLKRALQGTYSPALVLLSIAISVLAAFVALQHVHLIRATGSRGVSFVWHLMAALALGSGVWAMHFVGMLAFELPVTVGYRLETTLGSLAPAALAAFIALQTIIREPVRVPRTVLGGTVMGLGICAMHYIGMSAMVVPAQMYFEKRLFFASIGLAVVMGTVALSVRSMLHTVIASPMQVTLLSSLAMGLAISSMHYAAMEATVYVPTRDLETAIAAEDVSRHILAGGAALATLLILLVSLISTRLHQRVADAAAVAARSESKAGILDDQLRTIASRVPGVVYQFRRTPDGRYAFPYASEALRAVFGVRPGDVTEDAGPVFAIIHPEDLSGMVESIEESARRLQPWQRRFRILSAEAGERWLMGNSIPKAEPDGTVNWNGFVMDVTQQKEAEETIQRLAFHDSLTNLPNRRQLYDQLERSAARLARTRQFGALFFVDLDRFKMLNDIRGHAAGDELLQTVARRLVAVTGPDDILARLGGDEFVVAVERLGTAAPLAARQAEQFGRMLLDAVRDGVARRDDAGRHCSASIGICVFGGADRIGGEEIVRRADTAMYNAKKSGGNTIRLFDRAMRQAMEARHVLEEDLREAVAGQQFELHFQKQVDGSGRATGAEGLIRWRHPRDGLVMPVSFMGLAEETGLIVPIGTWVLETACRQLLAWQAGPGTRHLTLAVNVSARQFYQDDFVDLVAAHLRRSTADPARLKIEITESLLLRDLEDARAKVRALRALGVRCAIDDFGTGYSSLSYLARLDVAELKIDRGFTMKLEDGAEPKERLIVEAIVDLGRRLGLEVCAEGVETAEQFELLKGMRCDTFQGYLFGRPAPLAEMALATGKPDG